MNRRGFTIVEVVVAVLVVAIIAATAYLFFDQENSNSVKDSTPESYQSEEDLKSASTELEETDVDAELDGLMLELDKEAAGF